MSSQILDERKQRERDFHNRVFDDHRRQAVSKFYAITEKSRACFSQSVKVRASGKRVLEYGCGEGSMAFDMPDAESVTGIDISDVAILRLSERARGNNKLRFLVMDAENLEFPNASFDLVCGSGILHHLRLDRAYAEISRVLAPGGTAVFLEPLGHNPFINFYRRMTPDLRSIDEHPLLISDLESARRYFRSINLRFFHLATLGGVGARKSKYFRSVIQALDKLDVIMFAMIPWLQKFAWISVIALEKQS